MNKRATRVAPVAEKNLNNRQSLSRAENCGQRREKKQTARRKADIFFIFYRNNGAGARLFVDEE